MVAAGMGSAVSHLDETAQLCLFIGFPKAKGDTGDGQIFMGPRGS